MVTSSIKTKLLVLIFISVTVCFGVLAYQNATNAHDSKFALVKNKESNTALNIADYFDTYFKSKISIVNSLASNLESENMSKENKELITLLNLGKRAGEFGLLFIGFSNNGNEVKSDGKILTLQKDNFDARKRPWFKKAVEKKDWGITKPYWGKSLNTYVITLFKPIFQQGKLVAVLGADIPLKALIKKVLNEEISAGGYVYIVDNDGEILIHKDKKSMGKKSIFYTSMKNQDSGYLVKEENQIPYHIFFNKISSINWYTFIKIKEKNIFSQINKELINMGLLFVVLLAIMLIVIYLFLTKFLSPLQSFEKGLLNFFDYLKGKSSKLLKLNINTKDEFGRMGKVVDEQMLVIHKQLQEEEDLISEVKSVVSKIESGDVSFKVTKNCSNKSLNELKEILNEMINSIQKDVNSNIVQIIETLDNYSHLDFTKNIQNPTGEVAIKINELCEIITRMLQGNKNNGELLNKSSQTLLENVNKLNQSSNETAVSLEESASALEEVTNTVKANSEDVKTMSQYSNQLANAISSGEDLANKTVEAMTEINEETKLIEEAILVIDQIAFQTNILSLNAAVEAATAGDAGKGFAVVAQEVRNLANRSAEAANEIKALVEKATSKTANGKLIADEMIKGYNKLSENVEKTTHIISSISNASNEQKTSIEQVNEMINRIDQQTQQNAAVAAHSQEVAQDTSNLAKSILENANEKKFRQ